MKNESKIQVQVGGYKIRITLSAFYTFNLCQWIFLKDGPIFFHFSDSFSHNQKSNNFLQKHRNKKQHYRLKLKAITYMFKRMLLTVVIYNFHIIKVKGHCKWCSSKKGRKKDQLNFSLIKQLELRSVIKAALSLPIKWCRIPCQRPGSRKTKI